MTGGMQASSSEFDPSLQPEVLERELSLKEKTAEVITQEAYEERDDDERRISDALGFDKTSPETREATDEYEVDQILFDVKTHTPKAETINDIAKVLIESADQRNNGGILPEDTPVSRLVEADLTLLPTVLEVTETLSDKDVMTVHGGDAAHQVMEILQERGVFGDTEAAALDSRDRFVDKVERARNVPDAVIERSGFKGPEIERAIKGYYGDHQALLGAANELAGDDAGVFIEHYLDPGSARVVENDDINSAIVDIGRRVIRAENPNDKGDAIEALLKLAYTEPSVGALTLSSDDIDQIVAKKIQILSLVDRQGVGYAEDRKKEELRYDTERRIQDTRNEVRPAGQLLFHNTMFADHVMQAQSIRGRDKQFSAQDGQIHRTTAGFKDHSFVPHWSEKYDPYSYKISMGRDSNGEGTLAATFAVPYAEMVKHAPFGRGLEYAVVEENGEVPLEGYTNLNDTDLVGDIGSGSEDRVGSKGSIDRVFFANNGENYTEATDYEVPVNGADIMMEDKNTGTQVSATYLIQSEYDQITTHRQVGAGNTWAHGYSPSAKEIAQLSSITSSSRGTGFGYPNKVIIENLGLSDESSWVQTGGGVDKTRDINTMHGGKPQPIDIDTIRKIQAESVARFEGKYVVPLRASGSDGRTTRIYFNDAGVVNRYGLNVQR